MFLLEGGAESIAAGVAVQTERARVVGDGVPVREDQEWRGGEVAEKLAYDGFHGRGDVIFDPLLEPGGVRA